MNPLLSGFLSGLLCAFVLYKIRVIWISSRALVDEVSRD